MKSMDDSLRSCNMPQLGRLHGPKDLEAACHKENYPWQARGTMMKRKVSHSLTFFGLEPIAFVRNSERVQTVFVVVLHRTDKQHDFCRTSELPINSSLKRSVPDTSAVKTHVRMVI
jgi:hypothetical protein